MLDLTQKMLADLSKLSFTEVMAGLGLLLGLLVFVPTFRALNDALSKAIYGLISGRLSAASVRIGGVQFEASVLNDVEADRSDPEYIEKIEAKLSELKSAIEAQAKIDDRPDDLALASSWGLILDSSRNRLLAETDRLHTRSQANLLFGVTVSFLGIVLLIFLLFLFPPEIVSSDWKAVVLVFGPRFALVIIVQLIGTFFFRMYVSNENDIKLNKNEITNVEMRLTAIAVAETSKSTLSKIAEILVQEERNFVLRKGERALGESRVVPVDSLVRSIGEGLKRSDNSKKST